jgi:hypothetical protein
MQITVNYQMTPAEFERGLKQVVRKRRQLMMVLIPVIVLGGALDLATKESELGVLTILLAVFYAVMLAAGPRIVASKGASRHLLPTKVTFTREGYLLRTDLIKTEARWQMLDKTEETGDFFLLFTGVRRATIVPKRAFTAEEAAELGAFLPGAPMSGSLSQSSDLLTGRGAR